MNIEEIREFCITKKGAEETFPFDNDTLVFKVGGKMFALASLITGKTINLKCAPERSIELREKFESIIPGYHMNKKHWNTVDFTSNLNPKLVFELIDHSYSLVVKGLTKKQREELNN